ncbi:MAG: GNAT family N-acetyltransferase [Coriobacteriales bacterium]|nr:GNAT family N-acetyltransferase [Coriobacteriales bacterium]
MRISYRQAQRDDVALVLDFVRQLAAYEHLLDKVVATTEDLEQWLFDKQLAEATFALVDGQEVGFALYFYNYSTFLGQAGLYIEDLFVQPQWRGHGLGKGLLRQLAQRALEQGCGRMEWSCLDWNQPSIDFYLSLGATPMDDWTTYRLNTEQLQQLAS